MIWFTNNSNTINIIKLIGRKDLWESLILYLYLKNAQPTYITTSTAASLRQINAELLGLQFILDETVEQRQIYGKAQNHKSLILTPKKCFYPPGAASSSKQTPRGTMRKLETSGYTLDQKSCNLRENAHPIILSHKRIPTAPTHPPPTPQS